MKRRVISFITALALCLGLCPTWAFADNDVTLDKDQSGGAYNITYIMRFNGGGHTYTVSNATAMVVQNGGQLFLSNGTVKSGNGAGVEVKNGGLLSVADPDVTVTGTTYGLDISSGALVQLSGGTFTATGTNGKAIQSADGYASLLKAGYAFFDESGAPILLTEVAGKTKVVVKKCTDHIYKYTANNNVTTHTRECLACGAKDTEICTFDFDINGHAKCADCGHTLDITIDPDEKVYDGKLQPSSLSVQFKLDGKEITLDYTVDYTSLVDVGETLVTVTSVTYHGKFETIFRVIQAQPTITWDETSQSVPYDGNPVEESDLPKLSIKNVYDGDFAALQRSVQFFYKQTHDGNDAAVNGADFTDSPPTDAGTYTVKAVLPETHNYKEAYSGEITLTIEQISPFIDNDVPKANPLTYNGTAQKLVTSGTLWPGAVIQFRLGEDGEWSEDVPTAVNAGDYHVYYKVDETNNFIEVLEREITVKIERKQITPIVELENTSYVYTGGKIQPGVTVRDEDDYGNPLHSTEYEVTYYNNENVGTAYVIVSDREGGNYKIVPPDPEVERPDGAPAGVIVTFEITPQDQAGLNIIGKPNSVSYGDEFTLNVSGGSGNGDVTWEIIAAVDAAGNSIVNKPDFAKVAEIDAASGQVTVKGLGTVTVQAKKTGSDYKETTAQWEFTVGPKRVTATVTAKNKVYDGNADAEVNAVVEPGDLVSDEDEITISGLSGTFSDANVGTNKAVTVDVDSCQIVQYEIGADGEKKLVVKASEKYIVIIPSTPVRADITKAETKVKTPPSGKQGGLTYDGNAKDLVEAGTAYLAAQVPSGDPEDQEKTETVTVLLEYALSESGTYSTEIPKATNAGSYEVWYRVRATDNYFGTAAQKVVVTISQKSVTVSVTLDKDRYEYDGTAKKPAVTVEYTESSESKVIPPTEYTVTYSNNVNVGQAKDEVKDEAGVDDTAPLVTVTAKADGNYEFGTVKKNFEITTGGKASLTKSPDPKNLTYNGQEQELVTAGTAAGGHLEYALANEYKDGAPIPDTSTSSPPTETDYKPEIPKGKEAGLYKVYYKVVGDGNYDDTEPAIVYVTIQPKKVTSPDITLPTGVTFEYDGNAKKFSDDDTKQIIVKDGDIEIPQTEYTVTYSNNINAGTATLHINDKNGGNYDVSGSTTFTINKAKPTVIDPKGKTGLKYNGTAQALIDRGSSPHGKMMYSVDGINYFEDVPTAVAVDDYTVYYKVLGDSNHEDSTAATVSASIVQNTVNNPTVELSAYSFRYDGSEHRPTVTVKDDNGYVIPVNEYTVTYGGNAVDDTINVGTYSIKITSKEDGNYSFTEQTKTVTILPADQTPLTITGKHDTVYYGDKIQLSTTGGTGSGTVTWTVTGEAAIDPNGLLTVNGVYSSVTVKATRTSGNYATVEDTWTFYVYPKPVTAVVTASSKEYDGTTTATLTVTVPGTSLTNITGVTGTFSDPNVGTNKTVTIDSSSATNVSPNYTITYPKTATADITPKVVTTPTVELSQSSYTYDGNEKKPAVTAVKDGNDIIPASEYTVEYSNNINAGTATVTVKNVTGGNYRINATEHFTIVKATPTVIAPVGKPDLTYTGVAQALVYSGSTSHGQMLYSLDGNNYFADIPTGTEAKTYAVYYKVPGDGINYNDGNSGSVTVTIAQADQTPLTIIDKPSAPIYYGTHFTLSTSGGSGSGTVIWESSDSNVATVTNDGLVTITGTGDVTITAKRVGDDNYNNATATWTFTAVQTAAQWATEPKAASGLTYTGKALALLVSGSTVNDIGKVEYRTDNEETWRETPPTAEDAGTYKVWYRVQGDTGYTGIEEKSVEVTIAPKPVNDPTVTYTTAGGINVTVKFNENEISSDNYTVTRLGDNDAGIEETAVKVRVVLNHNYVFNDNTHQRDFVATLDGSSDISQGESQASGGSTGIGSSTPGGTSTSGGTTTQTPTQSGTETASTQTTVKDGASSTVMNDAAGDKLVDEAVANQSDAVIIKPDIAGDVTKTEVSIPTSAVSRISSETNAALTISTPVADVTIPNEALGTLSGTGGAVSVVTERVENTVVLTLTADGKDVGDIPLMLTVPVEEAGPGTVAVLVYEDGTRETIRKSIAGEDGVRIPLNGSATVEIVDNRKEFTDVSAESWAADAVAFVSAHELFTGTAEATFSPELSMSRAMLTTVLHNLEGNPDQSLTAVFHDIGSGAWYEESVSWAVASGIVEGYGNGVFGPDDCITREQSIVMLWRYLGSPAAGEQILNFMDADQVSSYAMEALCWAAANGIVSGHGDGYLDPGGLATRAQAAQLLKNFIENT